MRYGLSISTLCLGLAWGLSAAKAETLPPDIEALTDRWAVVYGECRSLPMPDRSNEAEIERSCNERNDIQNNLRKKGWCYGPENVANVYKSWIRCKK
ncbi:exported hypothetical protein [Magnetospirillum molischianum DSM 120]|uniref:Secreted protein n=1 Tax=Magnetospirillum molischianum DSM 120 TaxID=1150626 RepID=H8FUF5_MAGML|nr:exported hypothetical protein [Magnetospirillum molischianum DSM 120]